MDACGTWGRCPQTPDYLMTDFKDIGKPKPPNISLRLFCWL